MKVKGIIAAVNTPFSEDGSIDLESLQRYVNHYLDCGIAGFLVPAMAAEVWKLGDQERKEMVGTVLDEVKGRVPVIGGASSDDRESRLNNAQILIELGCDAVLISIPFVDPDSFCRDILEIADLGPRSLVIQDWSFEDFGIPVETIVRLFDEIPCFDHLKVEVVPAGVKYSEVLAATDGQLAVSGGWASSQMIEGLDRGVSAFMATVLPDLYKKVYDLHFQGDRDGAQACFNQLLPIIAFSHQHLDISIHFYKRMLWKQGIFSTPHVREPIAPFDKYHLRIADELIDEALTLAKPYCDHED